MNRPPQQRPAQGNRAEHHRAHPLRHSDQFSFRQERALGCTRDRRWAAPAPLLIRLLVVLPLLGCRSLAVSHTQCAAPQRRAAAIPLDSLMTLAGKYRFVTIATSPGMDGATATAELTLRPADTLQRYYERRITGYARGGNRPLVGELAWRSADGQVTTEAVVIQQNPRDTQLISGWCRSLCLDGMQVYHSLMEVGPNRFSGFWHDPQTGIGRVVDKNGHELPDPAGYFCADRVP